MRSALYPDSAEHCFILLSELPSAGAPGQATSPSANFRPALLAPTIYFLYCWRRQVLPTYSFDAAPAGGCRQMDVSPLLKILPRMSTGYASVGFEGEANVWRLNVQLSIPV